MQTSVTQGPVQAYEGKVQTPNLYPNTAISRIASELIYFGKAVVPLTLTSDLVVGSQQAKLPTLAAEVPVLLGIAQADITVERLRDPASLADDAPFGGFVATDSFNIMRQGQIWVVVGTAFNDFSDGVFVRWQVPGGTAPTESLGSFDTVTSANHAEVTAGLSWAGGHTQGGVNFALLNVNL